MNTIALWYKPKNDSSLEQEEKPQEEKPTVKININLWKLPLQKNKKRIWKLLPLNKKKKNYFLDFGILVFDFNYIETIYIHFPFEFSEKHLEDLGPVIKNPEIVRAIFNENYSVEDKAELANGVVITKGTRDKRKDFIIFTTLATTKKISIRPCSDGTIVEINVPSDNKGIKNGYFRIRINNIDKQKIKFIQEYKPKNTFFQSITTATEVIDLRVNEKRNFMPNLIEKINKNKEFGYEKIHFLLIRDISDDLLFASYEVKGRELETDLWRDYVGNNYILEDGVIAYHMKETGEDKNKSANFLVKIRYFKTNWKIIIIYILSYGIISTLFRVIFKNFTLRITLPILFVFFVIICYLNKKQ